MTSLEKPAPELHDRLPPLPHTVAFYQDEGSLARSVGAYLAEGFRKEEAAVIIASRPRREDFGRELRAAGFETSELEASGRLIQFDAAEMLSRLMVGDTLDLDCFVTLVGPALANARKTKRPLRLYGEMVDLLWQAGKPTAAIRLEACWNRHMKDGPFMLFCAYKVDVLSLPEDAAPFEAIRRAHTDVLLENPARLEQSLERALEDLLGTEDARSLKHLIGLTLPPSGLGHGADRTLLWIRENLPAMAPGVLARARRYYAGFGRNA